ncbi:hypothetical protein BROUX41_001619 [Berkeleyomyces rouxiae]|uniref:uncharacterized protein n=1 Tax=Berkeleyomyces rouxiae TaxID=2035830 RepID=UPI003B7AF084
MAFTMHSHSGQFCPGHGKDTLEVVVKHAISVGLKTMGLTEHIPRIGPEDLYPEEHELDDPASLMGLTSTLHAAYLAEAQRLRAAYPALHILIGIEGEWYRPAYAEHMRALTADPAIDYFIGSVHHARGGIPIDYDAQTYASAVAAVGQGSERALYAAYYDDQLAMLQALRPRVVGHFDLIRLLSSMPDRDVRAEWPDVWERMVRNLRFVVEYGGWLECNTSALRKGLAEPYPARQVSEEYLRMGGRFTFSDDSHGTAQIITNYSRGLDYLESLGVQELWTFKRTLPAVEGEKGTLENVSVGLAEFRASLKGA